MLQDTYWHVLLAWSLILEHEGRLLECLGSWRLPPLADARGDLEIKVTQTGVYLSAC